MEEIELKIIFTKDITLDELEIFHERFGVPIQFDNGVPYVFIARITKE